MTLDEKSATCIALIAEASEENAIQLLNLLKGDARRLGQAIISVKQNENYHGALHESAKAIVTLLEKNRKKVELHNATRMATHHPHAGLAIA